MRKLLIALSLLVLLATVVSTATAQSEDIYLGGSSTMLFTGTGGGDWTLAIGGVSGLASGTGPVVFSGVPYSFTQTGTITGTYEGADQWDISQTSTLSISIGSYLSGSLQLLTLGQSGKTGTFNDYFLANLTGLSGSLMGYFPSGAILQVVIDLPSTTSLTGLGTGTLSLGINHGSIGPTPEPGSMVLIGSGLLLLGGLARRRRTAK